MNKRVDRQIQHATAFYKVYDEKKKQTVHSSIDIFSAKKKERGNDNFTILDPSTLSN